MNGHHNNAQFQTINFILTGLFADTSDTIDSS